MREFLLYSRTGVTGAGFRSLMEAGRLDILHQCAVMALFKSAAHRNDTVFHAVLNGPPSPPLHITIEGNELRDARTDERSWEHIIRNVLSGKSHPGIKASKEPFQKVIRDKHDTGSKIFVLNKNGIPVDEADFGTNPFFVIGDHIGLPKKDESFALRYGEKLSLGRQKYLAASCIDILNYSIDKREARLVRE